MEATGYNCGVRRRLFTILSVLSLLLSLAVLGLWAMSCVAPHSMLIHRQSEFFYEVAFDRGLISIDYVMHITPDKSPWIQFQRSVSDAYEPELGLNAELLVPVRWARVPGTGHDLVIALWLPALLFAALPAQWLWMRRRPDKSPRGFEVNAR